MSVTPFGEAAPSRPVRLTVWSALQLPWIWTVKQPRRRLVRKLVSKRPSGPPVLPVRMFPLRLIKSIRNGRAAYHATITSAAPRDASAVRRRPRGTGALTDLYW